MLHFVLEKYISKKISALLYFWNFQLQLQIFFRRKPSNEQFMGPSEQVYLIFCSTFYGAALSGHPNQRSRLAQIILQSYLVKCKRSLGKHLWCGRCVCVCLVKTIYDSLLRPRKMFCLIKNFHSVYHSILGSGNFKEEYPPASNFDGSILNWIWKSVLDSEHSHVPTFGWCVIVLHFEI